jgi:hypothetical protein
MNDRQFPIDKDSLSIIYEKLRLNEVYQAARSSKDLQENSHNSIRYVAKYDHSFNFYSISTSRNFFLIYEKLLDDKQSVKEILRQVGSFEVFAIPDTEFNLMKIQEGKILNITRKNVYLLETFRPFKSIDVESGCEITKSVKNGIFKLKDVLSVKHNKMTIKFDNGFENVVENPSYSFSEGETFNIVKGYDSNDEEVYQDFLIIYNENVIIYNFIYEGYDFDTKIIKLNNVDKIDFISIDNHSSRFLLICHQNDGEKIMYSGGGAVIRIYENRYISIDNKIIDLETKKIKLLLDQSSHFTFDIKLLENMKETSRINMLGD